ncbi:helix-turn-helix domain-containing protein [Achromobacter sp. DH1f]|uniref:helix-turn-helix domain-containing protein n=1 Tax=Achromobacter sp. DH1f TaxID=1397275 RepID=UPI0012FF4542|nr:helix-turn-helix domain-containing protein [Achromobacter sp. DH1f]
MSEDLRGDKDPQVICMDFKDSDEECFRKALETLSDIRFFKLASLLGSIGAVNDVLIFVNANRPHPHQLLREISQLKQSTCRCYIVAVGGDANLRCAMYLVGVDLVIQTIGSPQALRALVHLLFSASGSISLISDIVTPSEIASRRADKNLAGSQSDIDVAEWNFFSKRAMLAPKNGTPVLLSHYQSALVEAFIDSKDNTITAAPSTKQKNQINNRTDNFSVVSSSLARTKNLATHISRLKSKVKNVCGTELPVRSVRNVGYHFYALIKRAS